VGGRKSRVRANQWERESAISIRAPFGFARIFLVFEPPARQPRRFAIIARESCRETDHSPDEVIRTTH
jgi:hypothetical protein